MPHSSHAALAKLATLRRLALLVLSAALWSWGCTLPTGSDPMRYRLSGSGIRWDRVGRDQVLKDLLPRYPEYFAVVLDPARSDEPDSRKLRLDLEHFPVDRRNYDALNAVGIGYFEINYHGEQFRKSGDIRFMTSGFRTAGLMAIPWRAYGEIPDIALRNAILDFFQDVASGSKPGTSATAGRVARIVADLERKESDPIRRARIDKIVGDLRAAALPPETPLPVPAAE